MKPELINTAIDKLTRQMAFQKLKTREENRGMGPPRSRRLQKISALFSTSAKSWPGMRFTMGIFSRAHRICFNCLWSISAARPQLGAVACVDLDRVPRGDQLLRFAAESGGSWFAPLADCLFSLPS